MAKDIGSKIKIEDGKLIVEVPQSFDHAAKVALDNYGKNNRVVTEGRVNTVNQALRPNDLQMNALVIPPALVKYNGEGGVSHGRHAQSVH